MKKTNFKILNKFYFSILFLFLVILLACNKDKIKVEGKWLIPKDKVQDGGPGKDGIPSIDDPKFSTQKNPSYMNNNDIVVGIVSRDRKNIKAYSHNILNHHEIVNDKIGNKHVAITFCPLTGTAIGWDRKINGSITTFGVSGLLYNNNLIPYDRKTESNYSQMLIKCVNGKLIGQRPDIYQVIETTWGTWKKMYPNTVNLSTNTGYSKNYNTSPYGNYPSSGNILFPVTNKDNRLNEKERVLGIMIGNSAKAYRFNNFTGSTKLINDTFKDTSLVVIGNEKQNWMVAYQKKLETGGEVTLRAESDSLPVIMKDSKGNLYDIFGKIVKGPEKGERLKRLHSYIGYWFAWSAFYPEIDIYNR